MKTKIKRLLARCLWWWSRPWGLGQLGRDVRLHFPRRLHGRRYLHVGNGVRIGSHSWIEAVQEYQSIRYQPKITIADDCCIGGHCQITAVESVRLGPGCLLSEQVFISDHTHDTFAPSSRPLSEQPLRALGPVEIGPRCFIGIRAVIMPGVRLGEGCVVGANSVVTRSFPAGTVLAGAPARAIRTLDGF